MSARRGARARGRLRGASALGSGAWLAGAQGLEMRWAVGRWWGRGTAYGARAMAWGRAKTWAGQPSPEPGSSCGRAAKHLRGLETFLRGGGGRGGARAMQRRRGAGSHTLREDGGVLPDHGGGPGRAARAGLERSACWARDRDDVRGELDLSVASLGFLLPGEDVYLLHCPALSILTPICTWSPKRFKILAAIAHNRAGYVLEVSLRFVAFASPYLLPSFASVRPFLASEAG